ncbi:MAG: MBL fold metallo-hydrolase [Planctomycetota bacterium]
MRPITVTTLGTSHGNPTRTRFNSSVILETDDSIVLFDAGEPVTALLVRAGKSFKKLFAVCISHMHGDHIGGLSCLIKHLIKYPAGQHQVSIFLPEADAIPALEAWLKAQHIAYPSPVIRLTTTLPGRLIESDGIAVSAIQTDHLHRGNRSVSFAFVADIDGKRICYTGDLNGRLSDFPLPDVSQPYDLCLCEATHFDLDSALSVLKKAAVKKMVFTHVGDRWHDEGERDFWRWSESLPYPVALAKDGDAFVV